VFPFQFVVAMLCGWLQKEQEDVIAFLREEHSVRRRERIGGLLSYYYCAAA
jgi:hypothetical protein